jgi:hypothetical protein
MDKPFTDDDRLVVAWNRTQEGDYLIEIFSKSNRIFDFNTENIADNPGTILAEEVVLHTVKSGNERFVGFHGIGQHNDIFFLIHLSPGGLHEWIVDGHVGDHLRRYGCGVRGMKTRLTFDDGIGLLKFWVGNNENAPCKLQITFANGKFDYKQV